MGHGAWSIGHGAWGKTSLNGRCRKEKYMNFNKKNFSALREKYCGSRREKLMYSIRKSRFTIILFYAKRV
jgi:hypothetical protein